MCNSDVNHGGRDDEDDLGEERRLRWFALNGCKCRRKADWRALSYWATASLTMEHRCISCQDRHARSLFISCHVSGGTALNLYVGRIRPTSFSGDKGAKPGATWRGLRQSLVTIDKWSELPKGAPESTL